MHVATVIIYFETTKKTNNFYFLSITTIYLIIYASTQLVNVSRHFGTVSTHSLHKCGEGNPYLAMGVPNP